MRSSKRCLLIDLALAPIASEQAVAIIIIDFSVMGCFLFNYVIGLANIVNFSHLGFFLFFLLRGIVYLCNHKNNKKLFS